MAERTYITGIWRASQAAYRPWATTMCPRATQGMIPPTTKVCDSAEPLNLAIAVLHGPDVRSPEAWHRMHIARVWQIRRVCSTLSGA